MMASYGVPLTTLTERVTDDGRRLLTGRLGDAVVVGLPLATNGGAQRWRLTLLTPTRSRNAQPTSRERAAEWCQLADRAEAAVGAIPY